MSNSPRLGLAFLSPQQAQKHVTVNQSLRRLDALAQLTVKSRTQTAEPVAPAEGDAYILGATHTGAAWGTWAPDDVAVFQDGAWAQIPPKVGWRAYVEDEAKLLVCAAAGLWTATAGGESAPRFGVNTMADATTRLQVKADVSLFSHDDILPGTGDHRIKVNKSASARTASLIFQDGFSGRAEFGLAGDDDFRLKVSADGATWRDAMVIDRNTGAVVLPNTLQTAGAQENLLINGAFQVNQRVFAGGALSAGVYGFDRWKAASGGASVSVSGFTATLSSGELEQVVEPAVFGYASLASLQISVSVEAPSADVTATFGSQSGTIASGSGRRSVALTLGAGDTGNLSFKIKKASGSNVTFGRVKVEVGAVATNWQARPATEEFALCRRYCQQVLKGAPGSGASAVTPFYFQLVGSTVVDGLVMFAVPMRATPSLLSPPGAPTYQNTNPTSGNALAFYSNATPGYATATTYGGLSFNAQNALGAGVRLSAAAFAGTGGGVGNLYVGPDVNVLEAAEL